MTAISGKSLLHEGLTTGANPFPLTDLGYAA